MGNEDALGENKSDDSEQDEEECKLSIEGEDIEDVKKLKYLGAMIGTDGMCHKEIEQRVGTTAKVVGAMRKEVLERQELQKRTKTKVFNAMVVPTLIYGWNGGFPRRALQPQTSAETVFGMHLAAPSAWFAASAWSRQCRNCDSCRGSGTPGWPASPPAEHPSPWSTLSGGNGWT